MPGINLAINFTSEEIVASLKKNAPDNFTPNTIFNVPGRVFLVNHAPKNYPVQVWKRGEHLAVFEGLIYPFITKSIEDLLFTFFTPKGFDQDRINEWIANQDGEFVILLLDERKQQALVASGRFGRLPLYMLKEGRKLMITRNIGLAKELRTIPCNDLEGQAQLLLFGFTLGTKTLWERIERIKASSSVQIDLLNGRIFEKRYPFFLQKLAKAPQVSPYILIESLSTALENRIKTLPNTALSLSGGLDSRLIAALLKKKNITIPLFTYDDKTLSSQTDVKIARQLADRLECSTQHEIIELAEVQRNDVLCLKKIKHGLNGAEMAFIMPFLRTYQINNLTMLTGDGGDKTLDDLRPPIPLTGIGHLIKVLWQKHGSVDIALVSEILGIDKTAIVNSIKESLLAYGDLSLEARYLNFMLQERAMNWLFEGEDRNRHFIWTTTPYYNPDFFDSAMRLPMHLKKHGGLFSQLFELLPGSLAELPNPNWHFSIVQKEKLKWMFLKQSLKYLMPEKLITKHYKVDERLNINDFCSNSNDVFFRNDFDKILTKNGNDKLMMSNTFWNRLFDISINAD